MTHCAYSGAAVCVTCTILTALAAPEHFIVQIMTYKRPAHLFRCVNHIIKAPSVLKIMIIWNDHESNYHQSGLGVLFKKLSKPVEVHFQRENDVTSRWQRHGRVEEDDIILNIDDDKFVSIADIEYGFHLMRTSNVLVLGLHQRIIEYDSSLHTWVYKVPGDFNFLFPSNRRSYALIIGSFWFAKGTVMGIGAETSEYNLLRSFLKEKKNRGCDDIAWNMLLHMRGVLAPFVMNRAHSFSIKLAGEKKSGYTISSDTDFSAWLSYRSRCISDLLSLLDLNEPPLPRAPLVAYRLSYHMICVYSVLTCTLFCICRKVGSVLPARARLLMIMRSRK